MAAQAGVTLWGRRERSGSFRAGFVEGLLQKFSEHWTSKERLELAAISRESSPGFRGSELLAFAARVDAPERRSLAAGLYASLAESPALPQETRAHARLRLEALQGRGALPLRIPYLLQDAFHSAADFRSLLSMCAGAYAYRQVRWLAQFRLAQAGGAARTWLAGRLLPPFLGLAAEVPVYRAAEKVLAPDRPSADWVSTALLLGTFKVFHALGERGAGLAGPSPAGRAAAALFPQLAALGGALTVQHGVRGPVDLGGALSQLLAWNLGRAWAGPLLGTGDPRPAKFRPSRPTFLEPFAAAVPSVSVPVARRLSTKPLPPQWMANSALQDAVGGARTTEFPPRVLPAVQERIADNAARMNEVSETEAQARLQESKLLLSLKQANLTDRWEVLEQMRQFYMRQGRGLGAHRYPLLKQLEEDFSKQVVDEHLYEEFLRTGEDGYPHLKLPYGIEKPFALKLGPQAENFSLVGSDPFAKDRVLYPIYFRIRDLGLHQDLVSDLKLDKFRGLVAANKKMAPIKVGRYPDGGFFVYDGYHRQYAVRLGNYSHILGEIPKDYARILAPRLDFSQIRILPDAEVQRIIQLNVGGDLKQKQVSWMDSDED